MATNPPASETDQPAPLDAASRTVLKGTLVRMKRSPVRDPAGNSLAKYGLVRQLALSEAELGQLREHLARAASPALAAGPGRVSASTLTLLQAFAAPPVPALLPRMSEVAAVPGGELQAVADALVELRSEQLQRAQDPRHGEAELGLRMQSLQSAVVATQVFALNMAQQPIGMLNLERIEMTPAGLQRGELIATIPLAPGEETAVTHKEWSVTSKEFTTIVTDALEETSETGVTDNTDLARSTTSQNQHAMQFNITATVQGGIPMISGSGSTAVTAQDATSQSTGDSIKHATSVTQKASSRSRQEHRTTISTTTVTGSSETSTRTMKNLSTTDPVRIDYFSLMRLWRVRLYRFGLRLTYDMVVPEPGAAMRRAYAELETLRGQLAPFKFGLSYSAVNDDIVNAEGNPPLAGQASKPRYLWQADRYGVSVKPFPAHPAPLQPSVRGDGHRDWSYLDLQFNIPPGMRVRDVFVSTNIGANDGNVNFKVLGARTEGDWFNQNGLFLLDYPVKAPDASVFLLGATGEQKVTFFFDNSAAIWVGLKIALENTPDLVEQWRSETWNAFYNAEQTRHFGLQQRIAEQIAALEARLANVDTLTLRREESDEVMKCVLKFVLGTGFDYMPPAVLAAFKAAQADLVHGIAFDNQSLAGLDPAQWSVLKQHEDLIRFINQAIEWENVVTFLYSYFWDVPTSWAFIRGLRHPDATRQAFLRAGSARVVLTVRKGWETKWLRFTQDGTIDADIAAPGTGPYLTIAQEIAAYDDRNYPGIPPANPARSAVRLQDAVFTTCAEAVAASAGAVTLTVASSDGFVAGLQVVLDAEDEAHIQEAQMLLAVPDATHLVVAALTHAHDGTGQPFAVLQPGDKGALIAQWNEYTPSSGIDIAMTSNLALIA